MSADDAPRGPAEQTAHQRPRRRSQVQAPELEHADTLVVDEPFEGDVGPLFESTGFDDRYQQGELLGVGGMGQVRAVADRLTSRTVAMKTVKSGGGAVQAQRRFVREARIQAQLEHPSIVPVYDVGVTSGREMYFTMKRLRGESLAQVITKLRDGHASPRWTLRKLLTVLSTVAMTVEYAHRRGVLHRDLKPSNIMLGAFDEVYIIDWGLADVRAPLPPGQSRPFGPSRARLRLPTTAEGDAPLIDSSKRPDTGTGHVLGTPGYVAPEVCDPDLPDDLVDHRADVYALGVILFEVLTLQRLHDASTVTQVFESTIHLDGASPAERAPDRLIPPELDALCIAATRLDPAARQSTAGSFARVLETYLDGDRDLEQRRAVAAQRSEVAALALTRSRDTGADEEAVRALALREVVGALALDPDSPRARTTLVRLLTEPSRGAHVAAAAAHREVALRRFRLAGRNHIFAMLTYLLYLPLVLWMGVRSWPLFGVTVSAIVAVSAATFYYLRHPPESLRLPLTHLALSTIALSTGVLVFGPLVLVPAIAIATGVAYLATFGERQGLVIASMLTPVLLPIALQVAGVIPPWFVFEHGEIRIRSAMVQLTPTPTLLLLVITNAVVMIGALIFVHRLRQAQLDAERRLQLQAWQLAQIVPEETRQMITG